MVPPRIFIALRAAGLVRGTTRRCVLAVFGNVRGAVRFAFDTIGVAARAAYVPPPLALRAGAVGRATTRRSPPSLVVFTTVFIGFEDSEFETPGFKFVRILLFIYGYI